MTENLNTDLTDARVKRMLSLRWDSSALLESLHFIGEFYDENTLDARKSLRHDLEEQNIILARNFAKDMDLLIKSVNNIASKSTELDFACSSQSNQIGNIYKNIKKVMESATESHNVNSEHSNQLKEIENFNRKFQMTPDEVNILHNARLDFADSARDYFTALNKLITAFDDYKTILETNSCTVTSVELLDTLGSYKEIAYRRLFEWVSGRCEATAELKFVSDDVDSTLQIAIKYLRVLPIYYDQCVELVINARRALLIQKFVVALTQGSSSSKHSRAIDLYAHDSVRYIGDMLAWMHSAIAMEVELISAMFGPDNNATVDVNVAIRWNNVAVDDLVCKGLEGLGRPLRTRIAQTLEDRSYSLPVLYQLMDLLCFYEKTFRRIVKSENSVHIAVKESFIQARNLFRVVIQKTSHIEGVSSIIVSNDLYPLHITKECAKLLRDVMKVHDGLMSDISKEKLVAESVLTDDAAADDSLVPNPFFIDHLLGSVIQPVLQNSRICANQYLKSSDGAVFMLNNVFAISIELVAYASASNWTSQLNLESESWVDVLVREELKKNFSEIGFDNLVEKIDSLSGISRSVTEIQGLSQEDVSVVLKAFYASSMFKTLEVSPIIEKIIDASLKNRVREKLAEHVVQDYEKVYRLITDSRNKYDLSQIELHTVAQIRVLLGLN